MAHFLEHMMFKGCGAFAKGEIDRLTQKCGGMNNACTGVDATAYQFDLPAAAVDLALRIEADRMRGPTLEPREFEAERSVVLEEIAQSEDEVEARIQKRLDAITFGDHGYGHPVCGWSEDVEAATVESMRAFHARWYTPANACLAIAGDFDASAVRARIEELFGSIPRGSPPRRDATPAQPSETARGERRVLLPEEVLVPRFQIQFSAPDTFDPRADPLDLLGRVLAGGRSSRLYRKLVRERELLTALRSENDARMIGGVFAIDGEGVRGAEPEVIEALVFEELEALARTGPTVRELETAKNGQLTELVFRLETASGVAEDLGEAEMSSTIEELLTYPARIEGVTAARVQEACGESCRREKAFVVWSVPR